MSYAYTRMKALKKKMAEEQMSSGWKELGEEDEEQMSSGWKELGEEGEKRDPPQTANSDAGQNPRTSTRQRGDTTTRQPSNEDRAQDSSGEESAKQGGWSPLDWGGKGSLASKEHRQHWSWRAEQYVVYLLLAVAFLVPVACCAVAIREVGLTHLMGGCRIFSLYWCSIKISERGSL